MNGIPIRSSCSLRFTLNGREVELDVRAEELLLDVLRDRLQLRGAKRSCDMQVCGACTVLLDGSPVSACTLLALEVEGRDVLTVEGLGSDDRLHPLQQAFIDHAAVQCGFCTAGMLLTASALLAEHPTPSRERLLHGLRGSLCRCTGYRKILNAILAVANGAQANSSSPPTTAPSTTSPLQHSPAISPAPPTTAPSTTSPLQHSPTSPLRTIGRSVPRNDMMEKVTGRARYIGDMEAPGMAHARVLRSPYAHARIVSVDVSRARALPGVLAV